MNRSILKICSCCNGTGKVIEKEDSLKILKTAYQCLDKGMGIRESVNFIIKKYE